MSFTTHLKIKLLLLKKSFISLAKNDWAQIIFCAAVWILVLTMWKSF